MSSGRVLRLFDFSNEPVSRGERKHRKRKRHRRTRMHLELFEQR